jgi:hypothetical protein
MTVSIEMVNFPVKPVMRWRKGRRREEVEKSRPACKWILFNQSKSKMIFKTFDI